MHGLLIFIILIECMEGCFYYFIFNRNRQSLHFTFGTSSNQFNTK
jgi:hypothetical protein